MEPSWGAWNRPVLGSVVPSPFAIGTEGWALFAHLPEGPSIHQASGLIRTKLVWIHQKLASHEEAPRQSIFRRPEFVDGEGFYFLGQHYRLKLARISHSR